MNLLLLPGNSERNKAWIQAVNEVVAPDFTQTAIHKYRHWETGEGFINFDYETQQVAEHTKGLEPYQIFAKSVGSVLAIRGLGEKLLKPTSCMFVGLPLQVILKQHIPVLGWLSHTNVPIHIAQNHEDPLGSFEAVKDFFAQAGLQKIQLSRLEGTTHDYTDTTRLRDLLQQI